MRFSATILATVLGFVLLAGCEQPQAQEEPVQEAVVYEPVVVEDVEPEPVAEEEPAPQIHVVVKNDTLYSIARQHYGDEGKWKDLWEANKDQVPDKDVLTIGQELVIP